MTGMSRLFDEYGLDMWTWYPALDKAYADPKAQMWSAPQARDARRRQRCIRTSVTNLGAAIRESSASITRNGHPRVRMHSVHLFQNLLRNAIKYRGFEPPRIAVAAERREGEGLFGRDNGIPVYASGPRACSEANIFPEIARIFLVEDNGADVLLLREAEEYEVHFELSSRRMARTLWNSSAPQVCPDTGCDSKLFRCGE